MIYGSIWVKLYSEYNFAATRLTDGGMEQHPMSDFLLMLKVMFQWLVVNMHAPLSIYKKNE